MKVVAFIPIKLNNQRFPGKNLVDLGGKPLCNYIFETINSVQGIDERFVYCSSPEIKKYLPEGISFLQRDTYLDDYKIKGLEIISSFVREVDADIYILTHVTQPFTKSISIQRALEKVVSEEYDSAFSAIKIQDYLWMEGKPLNYDMKDIVRTQDLEPIYKETGAFFVFRKEVFLEMGQRIGNHPYIYEIDQFEAIDIDTKEDYELAKAVNMYLKGKSL